MARHTQAYMIEENELYEEEKISEIPLWKIWEICSTTNNTYLTKNQIIQACTQLYLDSHGDTLEEHHIKAWTTTAAEIVNIINSGLNYVQKRVFMEENKFSSKNYTPIQEVPTFIIPNIIYEMFVKSFIGRLLDNPSSLKQIITAIDPSIYKQKDINDISNDTINIIVEKCPKDWPDVELNIPVSIISPNQIAKILYDDNTKQYANLPMIYAYTVDNPAYKNAIKIGYTTGNVQNRIKNQTSTVGLNPKLEWCGIAVTDNDAKISFTDKDFHQYLIENGIHQLQCNSAKEWFIVSPKKSHELFIRFRMNNITI